MTDQAPELLRFVGMVRALLRYTNPCNVAEDHSQQWQAVERECNRIETLATRPPSERPVAQGELEEVCAEAYQVVGTLLSDTGQFDTEHGTKILDNLSEGRMVHKDVLPWRSIEKDGQRPVAQVREALEKIAGHRDYSSADHEAAAIYKREEGLWTTDEYLADRALTAERPEGAVAWRWRYKGHWILTATKPGENDMINGLEVEPLYAIQHEEPGRETNHSPPHRGI